MLGSKDEEIAELVNTKYNITIKEMIRKLKKLT